jgi:hypothetical protein
MKNARQAAGTKSGVGGREYHITYTGAVDDGVVGNADRDNVLVLVLWSPWTLGFASEITCSVTLYISLEA